MLSVFNLKNKILSFPLEKHLIKSCYGEDMMLVYVIGLRHDIMISVIGLRLNDDICTRVKT